MKSAIKWVAGILLILAGLGSLTQGGIVTAIFYSIGGAICIPPIFSIIEEKIKFDFQTWQKYLVVIGSMIVGGVAMPQPPKVNSSSFSQPVTEKMTEEQIQQNAKQEREAKIQQQKSQTISATALSDFYQKNEVKADETYKGKSFYISGSVMEIKKDIMNTPYVELRGDGVLRNVQCFFEDTKELSELNKGQKITIHGKCEGLMMNILIKDCKIVENL